MIKNSHSLKFAAIALVSMAALMFSFSSCEKSGPSAQKESEADSLINVAKMAEDYERMLTLCDSLEQRGDISLYEAAYWRGRAYRYLGKPKAIEKELRQALLEKPKNTEDSLAYFEITLQLVRDIENAGEYGEALQLALPALEGLRMIDREHPSKEVTDRLMYLTSVVGTIQMLLGMKDEAAKMFEENYAYAQKIPLETPGDYRIRWAILDDCIASYIYADDMASAEKWLTRQDSLVALIKERRVLAPADSEMVMDRSYMIHVRVAAILNRQEEFNRAVAAYKTTQGAKTAAGKVNLAAALFDAKHYAEAADEFAVLDQFFADNGNELSLDNLSWYGVKFEANYKAGRRDTALAVANLIIENLDSAIMKQKNSDAAELATVYQTQRKDAEIAQQQIALSRQRWIGTLVALVLLTTFFMIYTWYRRRAANRLGAAHVKLQKAYDQLEETTAAKERIESELRIARDIQMSMVPGLFPEREGLDMHAEMTPAKEVGGDLYGYVMQGDVLYFCVGDVSGKGVPASLFMAQSARLFRTLAAEGMMPADIAVRMNNALAENNDRGMFVTMFIGMLHLDTGRLDYCNCGHNPPILVGSEKGTVKSEKSAAAFLEMQYDNQPLGLWEDDPFEGESIEDVRGRQLLIYTDGLNEAENAQQQLLGNARLLELMADTQGMSSHEVIEKLKSAVEAHRAGAEPNDDLTLMCITLKE